MLEITEASDLVQGRKLELPVDGMQAIVRMKLQTLWDENGYNSSNWIMFKQLLLALRELEDLRGKEAETPRERLTRKLGELKKKHNL